jgi:hypothetical protein
MFSKYSGDSHSPRNESSRSTAGLKWFRSTGTVARRVIIMSEGSYNESEVAWARPALMPTDVWTHRKNGELCITTLKRFRLWFDGDDLISDSILFCSRMLAIWLPTCLDCKKPPYVRGGS